MCIVCKKGWKHYNGDFDELCMKHYLEIEKNQTKGAITGDYKDVPQVIVVTEMLSKNLADWFMSLTIAERELIIMDAYMKKKINETSNEYGGN